MTHASRNAHDKVKPKKFTDKAYIFALIEHGVSTVDTIVFRTKLNYSTVTARLSELYDDGLIMPEHLLKSTDKIDRFTKFVITPPDKIEFVKKKRRDYKIRKALRVCAKYAEHLPIEIKDYFSNNKF